MECMLWPKMSRGFVEAICNRNKPQCGFTIHTISRSKSWRVKNSKQLRRRHKKCSNYSNTNSMFSTLFSFCLLSLSLLMKNKIPKRIKYQPHTNGIEHTNVRLINTNSTQCSIQFLFFFWKWVISVVLIFSPPLYYISFWLGKDYHEFHFFGLLLHNSQGENLKINFIVYSQKYKPHHI